MSPQPQTEIDKCIDKSKADATVARVCQADKPHMLLVPLGSGNLMPTPRFEGVVLIVTGHDLIVLTSLHDTPLSDASGPQLPANAFRHLCG